MMIDCYYILTDFSHILCVDKFIHFSRKYRLNLVYSVKKLISFRFDLELQIFSVVSSLSNNLQFSNLLDAVVIATHNLYLSVNGVKSFASTF